ncbi:MAG: ATP-binding cassette domain-containing protein [Fervidicoccus fontis]
MRLAFSGTLGYGKAITKRVELEIKEGKLFCVLGPNGAGKTTFLKTLAGIIPPFEGKVSVEDSAKKLYISPDPPYLPSLRIIDVILNFIIGDRKFFLYSISDDNVTKRTIMAEEILNTFGLKYGMDYEFEYLSTGEKSKVMLTGALVSEANLLFLDEPNSHLDLRSRIILYQLLKNESNRRIILISLHDLNESLNFCDSILLIGKDEGIFGPYYSGRSIEIALFEKIYGVSFDVFEKDNKIFLFPKDKTNT